MRIKTLITFIILLSGSIIHAQKVTTLNEIFETIDNVNPTAKMYAAQIRSLDEAAKGARSWMPTEFGTGFWMTPYNPKLWQKGDNGATGMGQYMLSAQQMFPNKKKQNAEEAYMEGMSASEKERLKFQANQLYAEAKKNYYQLIIQKKKLNVLNENAVVFEDSIAGIQAANSAKMTSIGIGDEKILFEAKYLFKKFNFIDVSFIESLINLKN